MKRIKMLLILIIPIFLTGCSETLKCTIETNNYKSKIKIKFEKDKPTTYKYKDEMRFSSSSTDAEIYYHSKYDQYSLIISDKHANLRDKADGVYLKINYDFTKDKSEGENSLLITRNDTKKTALQKIQSSGYTCK